MSASSRPLFCLLPVKNKAAHCENGVLKQSFENIELLIQSAQFPKSRNIYRNGLFEELFLGTGAVFFGAPFMALKLSK
jgi:hypothetical protein